MNKRVFYIFALIASVILVNSCNQADKTQMLLGDWSVEKASVVDAQKYLEQYKAKFNPSEEELNSEKDRIENMPESYYPQGITMSFMDDSTFVLGGIEGQWTYDKENNVLNVHFSDIDNANFEIKSISKDKLVLLYESETRGIPFVIEIKLHKEKEAE